MRQPLNQDKARAALEAFCLQVRAMGIQGHLLADDMNYARPVIQGKVYRLAIEALGDEA